MRRFIHTAWSVSWLPASSLVRRLRRPPGPLENGGFVSGYSCATAPDFHGLPFSTSQNGGHYTLFAVRTQVQPYTHFRQTLRAVVGGSRSVAGGTWGCGYAWVPVTGRVALRPNRSLRAERAVSLACAALANRQIGFGRVRFALQPFPHRCVGKGANCAARGTGAFGRSAALPRDGGIYPVAQPR